MTPGDLPLIDTAGVFDHQYERIQHYVDKIMEHRSTIYIYPKENPPFLNMTT